MVGNITTYLQRDFAEMPKYEIGKGSYGITYKGRVKEGNGYKQVVIKVINNLEDCYAEKSRWASYEHPNVLKLVGLAFSGTEDRSKEIPWIILDFPSNGNMKDYLKSNKCSENGLMLMSKRVASAMEYLVQKNDDFVHKDLAARNVIVGFDYLVKIGEYGLCNHAIATDYFSDASGEKHPVRWMPPENLPLNEAGKYSREGDVWSYGVFLYELWSEASFPYGSDKTDVDVMNLIKDGTTPIKCQDIPAEDLILDLMNQCWLTDPQERPSFEKIVDMFNATKNGN